MPKDFILDAEAEGALRRIMKIIHRDEKTSFMLALIFFSEALVKVTDQRKLTGWLSKWAT
jgi:hypothetical protein